jgi:hypothetical protein
VQNGISLACIELLDDVMVDATNKESKVRQWPVKPRCVWFSPMSDEERGN